MKKRILIIAYYYPPCIGIAANRPAAIAHDFSKNHEVKVVTRHWKGDENNWEDYLCSNTNEKSVVGIDTQLEINYLPYNSKLKPKNKIRTFFELFSGRLDPEIDTMQFQFEIELIIKRWKPDFIFVSSPPLNIIHLASCLCQKYRIPYFVDFRDFENEIVLKKNRNFSIAQSATYYFRLKQVKKDLKNAAGISSINSNFDEFFKKLTKKKSIIVYNGYEQSIFKQFIPIHELKTDTFLVSIIGTVYENQDLSIFLSAFQSIIQKYPDLNIRFNFIGTDTIPEIGAIIREVIPLKYLYITGRIPREEALKYLENSHLIWQPEMPGYQGVFSGKIFEYLGANRPILVAPSQNDVLDKLLEETNAGKSFNTSQEITEYILLRYEEWKNRGYITYEGDCKVIEFYSRENQSKILLEWMLSQLDNSDLNQDLF